MRDKYFLKKEKLANLLFDLVKYLLTGTGALLLFSDKPFKPFTTILGFVIAIIIVAFAIYITPLEKE